MSIINKLASFENDIDFPKLWKRGAVVSVLLVVLSLGAIFGLTLNLGIDFEGGSAWEVPAPGVTVADARDVLRPLGEENAKIQIVGDDTLRVQAETVDDVQRNEITDALAELAGVERAEVSVSTVGPTWGEEISSKALRALIVFFVLISAYIWIRLEWKMAVGALVAVLHDLIICVGVYALFQFEVTPATVIAFLTILGYSLYDTIVVYDKVAENANRSGLAGKMTYTEMMSLSLNQVLMRSLNTTLTSIMPILAMLIVGSFILGAVTLQEFSVALLVGLISGAYSSIFVATPLVAWLKEREPEYRSIRARLEGTEARKARNDDDRNDGEGRTAKVGSGTAPTLSGRAIPARPRKQGKRR